MLLNSARTVRLDRSDREPIVGAVWVVYWSDMLWNRCESLQTGQFCGRTGGLLLGPGLWLHTHCLRRRLMRTRYPRSAPSCHMTLSQSQGYLTLSKNVDTRAFNTSWKVQKHAYKTPLLGVEHESSKIQQSIYATVPDMLMCYYVTKHYIYYICAYSISTKLISFIHRFMRFNQWLTGSTYDPLTQYLNRVDNQSEFNNIGLNKVFVDFRLDFYPTNS